MIAIALSSPSAESSRGIVVERPNASDAVGCALRGAYDRDPGLPADMMRLLRILDKKRG